MTPVPALFRAGTLATLSLLAAPLALAQAAPADGQWRGTAGAAFSATAGNSSTSALALNAEMQRATEINKFTLGASSQYARSRDQDGVTSTTANKWAAAGQYDHNLGPQLFVFGKLGLEGDTLIELNLRSTVAGGVGLKLIDTKPLSFTVFGGAAYTVDRYDTPQTIGGRSDTQFSRSSVLIGEESVHQLATNTSFKQRLELYPGVSGDKALLAKFNAGLQVAVSSALNVSAGLVATHNSKPPVGSRKTDLGLLVGVTLRFGAP